MATPEEIQKQSANRPKVTPVGDVKAATARAATSQAGITPSQPAALKAPSDFVGDAAGNVQRNTPSAHWTSQPGASGEPLSRSAAKMTQAPDWQTTAGAQAPEGTTDFRPAKPPAPSSGNIELESAGQASRRRVGEIGAKRAAASSRAQMLSDAPELTTTPPTRPAAAPAAQARPAAAPAAAPAEAPASAKPAPKAARTASPKPSLGEAPNSPHRSLRMTEPKAGSFGSRVKGVANAVENAPAKGFVGKSARALTRTLGGAGRLVGAAYGINQVHSAIQDMQDEGANAANVGDAAAGTAGVALASNKARRALASGAAKLLGERIGARAVPVLGAAVTGWDIGRAIAPTVNRLADEGSGVQDTIGGTVNHIVRATGNLFGQDWGVDEAHEDMLNRVNSRAYQNEMAGREPQDNGATGSAATMAAPAAGSATQDNGATGSAATMAAPAAGSATQTMTPEQAMASNAPGTAVINGRVISPEEIKRLANRNVVSSEAFTNPSVGDLYSQTHDGATPTTDQAIAFRQDLSQSPAAQRMFGTDAQGDPIGLHGGIGAPQDQRQQVISGLMGKINDALRSGKRRTAKVLVQQLAAFDRASQGDMDASLRRDALNKPPQATPQTAAQQLLDVSRAGEAQSRAQVAQMTLEQAKAAQAIQAKLQTETDPAKRHALLQNLSALTGKGGSADKVQMADFTVGDGINARKIPVPFVNGKPVISPEYVETIEALQRLSDGQSQAQ